MAEEDRVDNRLADPLRVTPPRGKVFPTPSMASVNVDPDASFYDLMRMNFERETVLGSYARFQSKKPFDPAKTQDFNFVDYIPDDLIDYPAVFATATDEREIEARATQLRQELSDKQLMAQTPIKSFLAAMPVQMVQPENALIAGSPIYNSSKRLVNAIKSGVSAGVSGAISSGIQESVLSERQLSRTAEESAWNMFMSAGISGALGSTLGAFQKRATPWHKEQMLTELNDGIAPMTKDGLISGDDIAKMPGFIQAGMKMSPLQRLATSEFQPAKGLAQQLYEFNWDVVKNYEGKSEGISIEGAIKVDRRQASSAMLEYQDIYFESRGIAKGPFRGTRDKLGGIGRDLDEFNYSVVESIITGVESSDSHVKRGAEIIQNKVFKPMLDRLVALGKLPEGVTPKNAAGYFMTLYNKQKIIEQGGNQRTSPFYQALYNDFKNTNEEIQAWVNGGFYQDMQARIKTLKDSKRLLKKSRAAAAKRKLKKVDQDLKAIEKELLDATPDRYKDSKGKLREISTDEQLHASTSQTIDNILGNSEGVLLNPVLDKLTSGGRPLKERKMTVDQKKLMPWLINDPMKIADMYVRGLAPIVSIEERAVKNGYADSVEWMKGIEKSMKESYEKAAAGKTGKEADKLNRKYKSNLSDIRNSFELLKGVYGDGPNVLSSKASQFYRNVLTWNAMRLLGFMTIGSFADMGNIAIRNGIYRTLHEGLVPALKGFGEGIATRDLKALGYALETELGTRLKSFAEHSGLQSDPGPFQRAFDQLSMKFGNLTLMNQWNDFMQKVTGHVTINRILENAAHFAEGKRLPVRERKKMAQLGLTEEDMLIIAKKTEGFIDVETGARYADWPNWSIDSNAEAQALQNFKGALAKEIDATVIVPGLGDKPLVAQKPLGRALFQFKTFMMGSTNKVMLSSIQNLDDLQTWTGLSATLALGALSYVTTSLIRGDEPDYSFGNMAYQAVDRSGALGIIMEGINIGNKAGLIPGMGSSRYQTRTLLGALIGPSGGALDEVTQILAKLNYAAGSDKTLTTKDAEKMLRLMPLQNLFYLYRLNKAIARKTALNLGFEDRE